MKTTLRLATLLVAWLALADGGAFAQTALNRAAPIIPKSFGATAIKPLASNTGTPGNYQILSLPTQGTLRVNGNPITTVPTTLTVAQGSQLSYAPNNSAPAGNYSFTYRTSNNATVASFSLPISNANCSQNSAIDFSERTAGENWKAQTGVQVGNTTVSTSGYTSSVPAGQTNILQVSDATTLIPNRGLFWQLDNEGVSGDNRSTVQMNFSRPVRNLAFSMEDIDVSTQEIGGSDFIDEVTFNAYALGSSTPYQLSAADVALGLNGSNEFVSGTNIIRGTTVNDGPQGTVVLTFPSAIAISRLEIIYRNTRPFRAGLRLQTINLPSMVWCAEVDLATTLTGPARAIAGQTVTYSAVTTNQGDIAAAGVQASVQLSAGLTNVTINGAAAGANYNTTTGVLTLPPAGTLAPDASSTATITFTMPTPGPVTGRASSTTTGLDIEPVNNNGSLPNAQVTTTVNRPPTAQNVTAPTMPNTNAATDIPSLQGSDPDGDNTIVSYLLTNIPNPATAGQGTLSYFRAGVRVNLLAGNGSSTQNRTLTPAEMATLQFDPLGTFTGNATFNYLATDDLGATSNTATYTIPVGAGVGATDLAVTQQVNLGPYLVGDLVTFTVVASNTGNIAAGVQVRDALPAGLTFVGATTTQGTYDNATGVWTVTPGVTTFASGASATLTITARIAQNGTFTNTAVITATTADTNPLNNEASQQVNAGESAYRQDFEGRTATDLCETYSNMAITNVEAQVITGNTSLISNNLANVARYLTPLLRLNGSSSLSFQYSLTNTNGAPAYQVSLVDAAGVITTVNNVTAITSTSTAMLVVPIPQTGVFQVRISFGANAGATSRVSIDEVMVTNATVATQAKDGSNCDANIPPVASDVSFRIANGAAATTIPSLAGTDTAPGVVDSYIIQSVPNATTQGLLTLNGVAVSTGQIITAAQAATLQFDPVAGFVGEATFLFSAIDDSNELSVNPATYTISVENATTIAGRIYDDVNYGGGAGRNYATANTSAQSSGFASNDIARGGAVVELYDVATNQLVNTLTTAANGTYSFPLVLSGNYAVRVVNSTVTSARNATAAGVLPVQTFVNGDVNRVGGEIPTIADAPQNNGSQTYSALNLPLGGTSTLQSVTSVVIPTVVAPATNVDFGFNFSTITNTNDTGAGSLRQFITNSNTLPNTNLNQVAFNGTVATGTTGSDPAAGVETSIFMLSDGRATGAPAGLRNGLAAPAGYNATTGFTVTPASALPTIIDNATALDGNKQANLTGNKVLAVTEVTTGPEVTINFNAQAGLLVTGGNTLVASVGLNNANGGGNQQGAGLTFNTAGASGSIVQNVTATGNLRAGVRVEGGVTNVAVLNNVLNNNLNRGTQDADGLELLGTTNATVTGNVLNGNLGYGIFMTSANNTGATISNNIIRNNGTGTSTADAGISVGVQSDNNLFSMNTITGNAGDGIVALNGANGNRFTQNSFSGNGDLGIDLTTNTTVTGNGQSINDNADSDIGANGILNFPVITQLSKDGTNLRILGYAPANALVEFFVADVTTAGFGEGRAYLASRTEGNATDDTDNNVGTYSGLIYGVDQGSETNARRFSFTILLSSLSADQLAALNSANARITATATILSTTLINGVAVGNTSEFSGNAIVSANPLPVELKAFEVASNNASAVLSWSTASEKNNDHFNVERSFDGASFERIGQVQGRGTTSQTTNYSFTDANVGTKHAGVVYYRLQQVDTDGTATYSPVRTVRFAAGLTTGAAVVGVYPNPVTSQNRTITLELTTLPTGTYEVTVLDATGRVVRTQAVQGGQEQTLDVQQLPTGMYLVQVRGNSLTLTQRFSKQ